MKPTSLLVCNYKPWRLIALVLLLSTGFVRAIPLAVAPPGWSVDPGAYQYSMNMVARVSYLGAPTNAAGNIVGVFVGNELRGVATPVDVAGVAYYFITVYSNKSSGETLRFKVYYQPNDAVYTSLELRTFQPQAIVGALATPFWIPVDNTTDVPPAMEEIPRDTTLVGIPFETINLADYLVSDDGDPVVYSAVPGANLTASISGSVLTVTPVSGVWTGMDTVRVVATEQTANMKHAATTPRFTVQPFYNPPVLGAIPPQQINVGQQFVPYDLDESLTFSGPCRAFDYFITPFSGADAAPVWSAPAPGAGAMTIVARALFDDLQLAGAGAELAAFRGGVLVGKAGPSGVAPNVLYNLTLANQGSGNITFKLYDADRQYLYTLDANLPFVAGGSAGTSGAPYLLQFCPLTPAISASGVVTMAINQPNWLGDLSVHYVVWDCPYAALSARRDTSLGVYTMFYSPNPSITSASSVSFQENTCQQVYDTEAYDPNYTAGNSLRYRISGGADQHRFRLDSITGILNWDNFIPNFESPADANADNRYLVTIQVRNPDNLTGQANLEVVVTDNPVENFSPAINNGATVCLSPTAVLTASGGGTYLWSTGQTSASIGVTLPGVYSVTVTNNVQCTGVASANVIADSAPTVSCPPASAMAYTVAGATCQTTIPDYISLLVPTDACSVTISEFQSIPPGTFPVINLGNVILVEYAATDISSNSTRCTVSLTVNDDDAPTVACPPATTTIATNGANCTITIPDYVTALSPTDNCTLAGDLNEIQSVSAGAYSVSGDGATVTVTYTVTDDAVPANSATCQVLITVNDDDAPTVSCPPATTTIFTNAGSSCEITIPNYISDLSPTDNCTLSSDLNESQSIPTGAFNVSGDGATVTVTYTVTDDATPANSASCQVVITVNDNDAPTFTCPTPANLTLNTTGGSNCAVNIPDLLALVTDAADNCGLAPVPVTQSIPAGANNGVSDGHTIPVTVTVSDAAIPANTASCVITFTVNDDDAPMVGCPPATETINLNAGSTNEITIPDYVADLNPSDNCTNSGNLTETQSVPSGPFGVPGNGATVTVVYTVSDQATPPNTTTCTVVITAGDNQPPVVSCPGNTTIETNTGAFCQITIPDYVSLLNPSDNVTAANDLNESQSIPTGAFNVSGDGATVTVTYTVTDDATPANSASCQVVITVDDNDAPTFTCPTPASLTLNTTGGSNCAVNIPNLVALVTDAADNCSLSPTPITQSIPAGANNGVSDGHTIPVTVTVSDAAIPANTASCVITFTVNDDDAPTVGCPPATTTIATNGANCIITIPDYVTTLSPTDNCTLAGNLNETQSIPTGAYSVSGDGATVTVTYTVTDDAMPANSATCQVLITVNDDDAPTVSCPAATTTIFTNSGSSCEITIPNYVFDLSPTDNCTLSGDLNESQSISAGALNVSGDGATVTVTYTVTDDATPANSASCQVLITVDDNEAPTFTCPTPANLTLNTTGGSNCAVNIPNLVVLVTDAADNCSLAPTPITQSIPAGANNGVSDGHTIPVTVTVSDAAIPANTASCVITFTVNDDDAPTVACPPATTTIATNGANCTITIPDYVTALSPTDNCTLAGDLNETQSVSAGAYSVSGDGATVTVTYTVTDDAIPSNSTSCQVLITVNDDDAPTVSCPAATTTIFTNAGSSCEITIPNYVSDLSPTDNCTLSGDLNETQSISAGAFGVSGDGATVTVTYTVTDDATPANSASCQVVITVDDNDAPSISGVLTPTTVEGCAITAAPAAATTVAALEALSGSPAILDNCAGDNALTVTYSDINTGACPIVITRTYAITDPSGNSATITHTIHVGDTTPPAVTGDLDPTVLTICNVSDTTGPATTVAALKMLDADADLNISDACTPDGSLSVACTSTITGAKPTFTLTRIYSITDLCGNTTFLTHVIPITVTCFTISGRLLHSKSLPSQVSVVSADVRMTGSQASTLTSGADGQFTFGINTSGFVSHTVTIRPRKLTNKLNGITTADATRIQQHIVGIAPFTDPFDLVAADLNKSKSINSTDVSILSQALRNNQAALLQFDSSWRFVAGNHTFPAAPYYPTPAAGSAFWNFPPHRSYTNLTQDRENQTFIGVKLGDVTVAHANPATRPAKANPLILVANDRLLRAGEETTVSVRVLNFTDIAALQFVLDYDNSRLEFINLATPPSSPFIPEHFGLFNLADGEIRAVWSIVQGLDIPDGSVVLNLTFKALEDHVRLSEQLHLLDDEVLPREAYHTDLSPVGIELEFLQRARPTGVASRDGGESDPEASPVVLLLQNQPNPFHDQTTIGFVLGEAMHARLRVFDATGRLLFERAAQYPAGYQAVEFRLDQQKAPGLLMVELTTKYGTQTRKMNVH